MKTLQLEYFKKQLQGFYLQIPPPPIPPPSHLPCKLTPSHHWIVCAFMQRFLSACALKRAAREKLLRPAVVLWWWCKTGVFPHLENILFFPSSAWLRLQIFPSNLCLTHETKKSLNLNSASHNFMVSSHFGGFPVNKLWSSSTNILVLTVTSHMLENLCLQLYHWYTLCNYCHSRRPSQCRVKQSSE